MSEIEERIEAWEASGLIDSDTAARLRAAEHDVARENVAPSRAGPARLASVGSAYGPAASIPEMFAYLGSAFVIAAYSTFLARVADQSTSRDAIFAGGSALLTAAVILVGAWLARRDERSRRGGGVLFLVAVIGAGVTANFVTQVLGWSWGAGPELFVAVATLGVAIVLRSMLAAIATHVGVLGAITLFGVTVLDVVRRAIEGRLSESTGGYGALEPRVANLANDVLLPLIGWLALAFVIGLIGLWEARRGTAAAHVRASMSRFWAGIVAVGGTWAAVSTTGYLGPDNWGRILEPWIGDAIVGVIVAILVERAIRRDAAAYILPAALGLIAALTDLNFRYLTDSTEVGLLLEGAILLGVGFAADRIRRRLGGRPPQIRRAPPTRADADLPSEEPIAG